MSRLPRPIARARQLRLDLARDAALDRESLIVSSSNAAAIAAVDAWPRWPGGRVALIGPAGSGKTHLGRLWAAAAGAVAADRAEENDGRPLLLEDADRGVSDADLFHAFNLADEGRALLITARTSPGGWPVRVADLRSRLRSLTVATIEPPDDVILARVMAQLFRERNIRPAESVADYILRRIERSVPAIQELIVRIDEVAQAGRREVNIALVREILNQDAETP
jgi:chromosomal replication initiation ATPase DnaA